VRSLMLTSSSRLSLPSCTRQGGERRDWFADGGGLKKSVGRTGFGGDIGEAVGASPDTGRGRRRRR
jgi:hypothetical protein